MSSAWAQLLALANGFDSAPWAAWCAERLEVPLILSVVYVFAVVVVGSRWLQVCGCRGRPLSLATPLLLWNMLLAVFSFFGFAVIFPELVHDIRTLGALGTLCPAARGSLFGSGARGVVMLAFMLSKVPELLDTAFLIARGKPVGFLHWFHHFSVLSYCWFAYARLSSNGFYFATMNYAVHALMYTYYALQAAGARPTWGAIVTRVQIAQMIAGCVIVGASAWLQLVHGRACEDPTVLAAAAAIYTSYLALFVRFFFAKMSSARASAGAVDNDTVHKKRA